MTFDFHDDRATYFRHQAENCRKYIIPFIREGGGLPSDARVLEIGCGEGGVVLAFAEAGCRCVGVERNADRLELARRFIQTEAPGHEVEFITDDVYDVIARGTLSGHFDLIVLKDVIEHIHDQARLVRALRSLLAPNGRIFFGFPPWHMPFGGHQQMCRSKVLSKLPYFHLLPMRAYRRVLSTFGETDVKVRNLAETKETGITIARFERILSEADYEVFSRRLFLVNPIYRYKFGMRPRVQLAPIAALPHVRDLVTTTAYYLVG